MCSFWRKKIGGAISKTTSNPTRFLPTTNDVDDIIDVVVNNLSEELEKIFTEQKPEKQSYEELGITFEEKDFYDILLAVAERYGFKDQLSEETYIFLAKEIQKLVGNKSKYTDWTNR